VCKKNSEEFSCDWSVESFNELKKLIAERVPERRFATETELVHETLSSGKLGPGSVRSTALRMIEDLDPAKALEGENEMAMVWKAQARSSPGADVYEKRLAEIWRELGCVADKAPYVLRGLLGRMTGVASPFAEQSPQLPALAAAFLDQEHCPSANGLAEAEKTKLKKIRDRPPPPAPKQ
jgi:hypothetical protein